MKKLPRVRLPLGAVLYRGPSELDPSIWIVLILTGLRDWCANVKTGDMIQAWVLVHSIDPITASRTGVDTGICGDCDLRHHLRGPCYVVEAQAPTSIYKTFRRGGYDDWTKEIPAGYLTGRLMRAGAYGDPLAVPKRVWRRLLSKVLNWTGYTHQWDLLDAQWARGYFMASVSNEADAELAQRMGWRTFRVGEGEALEDETHCVADSMGVQCVDCMLCSGQASGGRSIFNPLHGSFINRVKPETWKPSEPTAEDLPGTDHRSGLPYLTYAEALANSVKKRAGK